MPGQITLTFPDGAERQVEAARPAQVAKAISPSLAKRTVAMSLNGKLADLSDPITADARSSSSPAPTRKR